MFLASRYRDRVRQVYTLKMSGDYLSEFHYFSVLFLSLVFSLQSAARIYCVLPSFILTTHQGERLFYPLEFSFCFLIRKMKISVPQKSFIQTPSDVSLFVFKVFQASKPVRVRPRQANKFHIKISDQNSASIEEQKQGLVLPGPGRLAIIIHNHISQRPVNPSQQRRLVLVCQHTGPGQANPSPDLCEPGWCRPVCLQSVEVLAKIAMLFNAHCMRW